VGGFWAHLTFFRNFSICRCKFLWRVALFFKTEMDNSSSNSTWARCEVYLSNDIRTEVYMCCMLPWALHYAPKLRLIPAAPKSIIHPLNLDILDVIRQRRSVTFFVWNLR
jgi:hypothetical protein